MAEMDCKSESTVDIDKDVKIVLDPVYGTIPLDKLAVHIINTPWFQRLRYIKQLAFADYVYPGATHTRFAHSIGVYHLARQMIKQIETHLSTKMDDFDKRCIRVAALCHDLGHGPFSHLYDQIGKDLGVRTIKHEDVSTAIMEQILRADPFFEKCFQKHEEPFKTLEEAIALIKKLIYPEKYNLKEEEEERYKLKKYIFQIVSNEDSGVDIDKWDYFNRDANACGLPERFQYDRALSVARVVKTDGDVLELAYRDYDAFNFYNMYNTRLTMYRKVYKHKAVVAVDIMMKDVFSLVGQQRKDSESESEQMDLFPVRSDTCLTKKDKLDCFRELIDSLLFKIKEKNKTAASIIDRIHKRHLYKLIIDILIPEDKDLKGKEEKVQEVRGKIEKLIRDYGYDNPNDVEIKEIIFDYGAKRNDPVSKLCFYKKGYEDAGYRISRNRVSSILPSSFQEVHLRVYYKKESPVKEKFKKDLEELEEDLHSSKEGTSVKQDAKAISPSTPEL